MTYLIYSVIVIVLARRGFFFLFLKIFLEDSSICLKLLVSKSRATVEKKNANRAKEEDTSRATHLSLADNVDHAKKKKFRSSMNSSFNAIYCGLIASNKDKTY